MKQAARAIVIEGNKVLVMRRDKSGDQYFTLVGGRVSEGENIEQALVREIREETGLEITSARLVFTESHPEPYNQQYIYLCTVGPHEDIQLQETSEESLLNRLQTNIHEPMWAELSSFARLPFRTLQLQQAIIDGVNKGFPEQPTEI